VSDPSIAPLVCALAVCLAALAVVALALLLTHNRPKPPPKPGKPEALPRTDEVANLDDEWRQHRLKIHRRDAK
jgi:hypothetical protein